MGQVYRATDTKPIAKQIAEALDQGTGTRDHVDDDAEVSENSEFSQNPQGSS